MWWFAAAVCVCVWTYEGGDAASADGGLEVALQLLLDGAGGVKALGQQDDGVDEEEGGDAVDDVLKDLDSERTHAGKKGQCKIQKMSDAQKRQWSRCSCKTIV